MASFEDFQKIGIRVGKIIDVEYIADAKYTTHKLAIDFGSDLGKKFLAPDLSTTPKNNSKVCWFLLL